MKFPQIGKALKEGLKELKEEDIERAGLSGHINFLKSFEKEIGAKNQLLGKLIQQEKSHRQIQTPLTGNNSRIDQLQNQLNQLQKQIQSLLANQKQSPDNSNNDQFQQQIQQYLDALQSKISQLEDELQNSASTPVSSSDKQELGKLKSQIQQLQKDLQNMSGEKKQQVDAQPQQFN
jgi:ElaB/YqjD/DUF883 family membrane-anchored ribosome-binding protein